MISYDPMTGVGLLIACSPILIWAYIKDRRVARKLSTPREQPKATEQDLKQFRKHVDELKNRVPDKTPGENWSHIQELKDITRRYETTGQLKEKYRPRPDLVWFDSNWGATLTPSPAEQLIIDQLNNYDIEWHREISFAGLKLSTGGWGRFDFYLPNYNTIIEYDSVYHKRPERAEVDRIKTQFCTDNDINLIRYNKSDYHHIPVRIADLMNEIHVRPVDMLC